jgi:hypothetical protein
MPLVILTIISIAAILPAVGTAVAVRAGMTRPGLLPHIAQACTALLALLFVAISVIGWIEWRYGRALPHHPLVGMTVLILLVTTPILGAGVFAASPSIARRILGTLAAIALIAAVAAAWFSPALPRGASRRLAQALSFRTRHVIAMPTLAFSAILVLFLVLRKDPS